MKAKKVYSRLKNKEILAQDIIDIRNKYELSSGKINGSKNIPMNKLMKSPEKYLNKEQTYYLICQSGARSTSTWLSLKIKGYKVKNISGGYESWKTINM